MDIYPGLTMGEKVLQAVIEQGLRAVQQDADLLKLLIQRLDPATQDELLNYLTTREVAVRLGFAREPWETPQISIVLASETEQRFIGDELAMRDVVLDVSAVTEAPILAQDKPPFNLVYSGLQNGPFSDQGRIQIDGEQFTYNSATPNRLHIVARHVQRTVNADHLTGATISAKRLEREIGSHLLVTYRIDVLADNADVVLWLQSLIKSVLFIRWSELDDEGFTEMQLAGSDFMPRPQFYPMFLYMRSLSLSTRIAQGVPQALVEALSLQTFPTLTGVEFKIQPFTDLS